MTVEQLAEQYAENIELDTKWNNPRQVIEQAYIAGYNEAQNTITQCNRSALSGVKWHKVVDGDLPKENHFVLVLNKQTGYEIARHAPFEEYHLDNWVTIDNRSLIPIKNNPSVIAWCEIPKYTEE